MDISSFPQPTIGEGASNLRTEELVGWQGDVAAAAATVVGSGADEDVVAVVMAVIAVDGGVFAGEGAVVAVG